MANRAGWKPMVLLLAIATGCDTTAMKRSGGARLLTGIEMDQVTAGTAFAVTDAAARALGSAPQTAVLATASAYSGNSPIAGVPFLDYASSQAIASARNGFVAQTSLSSRVAVDGANGAASIDAKAAGTGTSGAQVTAQFYGVSTNRADLVFGTVAAVACCGSDAGAQVTVDSRTGGPYSRQLRAAPVSDGSGQAQSRVDIAVVSSALPILDPAQVLAARAPARASPKY
jgi:hypothetical protein